MKRYPLRERRQRVYDLLSRRESVAHEAGKQRVNISPLVGAAFSSNWILFREVYDSYEKLTGQRWSRKHVRYLLECFYVAPILITSIILEQTPVLSCIANTIEAGA